MTSKPWFPKRWPPVNPEHIQLYSLATPNGQKIGICLEEMGLEYDAHLINILKNDQFDEDFLRINPNGKIPAMIDPRGPDGEPMLLMESVNILIYLAEKSGQLLPLDYRRKTEHMQWLTFQAAHIGPMFGQFGHFYYYAKDKTKDDYAVKRYTNETLRLLKILEDRLADRDFLMGDYSIVDIAVAPWVDCLEEYYKAGTVLELDNFKRVQDWRKRLAARPAYARGKKVCDLFAQQQAAS